MSFLLDLAVESLLAALTANTPPKTCTWGKGPQYHCLSCHLRIELYFPWGCGYEAQTGQAGEKRHRRRKLSVLVDPGSKHACTEGPEKRVCVCNEA